MFTDIEGSTRAERAMGSAAWAVVVGRHDQLMRQAIERHAGSVVKMDLVAALSASPPPAAPAPG